MAEASDLEKRLVYEASRKSVFIAYLLWFFLGTLGAHRFYLKAHLAVAMLGIWVLSALTALILIGYVGFGVLGIWWLIDAFLIPGMLERVNIDLARQISRT